VFDTKNWRQRAMLDGIVGTAAAFSPDGSRVATIGSDNIVRVLNAASGRVLALLKGHDDPVTGASFSPDGKLILTFSKEAILWDSVSGNRLARLDGQGEISEGEFTPDGTRIVTRAGREIWVWQASGGEPIAKLVESEGRNFDSMIVSPDGKSVAAFVGTVMTEYEIDTGNMIQSITLTTRDSRVGNTDAKIQAITLNTGDNRTASYVNDPFGKLVHSYDRLVLASQKTGAVWHIPWSTHAYVERVKEMLPRCLTHAERMKFYLDPEPPEWCIKLGKWPYAAGNANRRPNGAE
jgi:WD40 repeat protein